MLWLAGALVDVACLRQLQHTFAKAIHEHTKIAYFGFDQLSTDLSPAGKLPIPAFI